MTRDDIIRMAREAGLWPAVTDTFPNELERFANLVAAAEREKVAHWMMTACYATGHGDTTEDLLRELAWQADERIVKAVAAEREACAKVCDELVGHAKSKGDNDAMLAAFSCSLAIRERGAP